MISAPTIKSDGIFPYKQSRMVSDATVEELKHSVRYYNYFVWVRLYFNFGVRLIAVEVD